MMEVLVNYERVRSAGSRALTGRTTGLVAATVPLGALRTDYVRIYGRLTCLFVYYSDGG